jgi:transposase-like protein
MIQWPVPTKNSIHRLFAATLRLTSKQHRSGGKDRLRDINWRAVDQDRDIVGILVQKRRNKTAAKRFFVSYGRASTRHHGE